MDQFSPAIRTPSNGSRRLARIGLASLFVAMVVAPALGQQPFATADTVLVNGNIYTPGGWARSLAIKDGVIIAIGTAEEVAARQGARSRVVDLKGLTVLPGLHDDHVHAIQAGLAERQCVIARGSDARALEAQLRQCATRLKPGQWLLGYGWDAASLKIPLNKRFLDRILPDTPVVITDMSGHSRWLNSSALRAAGIMRDTPTPPGGVIERDAAGEPSGILREAARPLIDLTMPQPSVEERVDALRWAQQEMLSYGITSFTDAGLAPDDMAAFATVADRGGLKLRVRGCMRYGRGPDAIGLRALFQRDRLLLNCVKIYVDGVPTDGRTAVMVDPYVHGKGEHGDYRGLPVQSFDVLRRLVTLWDSEGLGVKFHASGDGAVRIALDAVEAARRANGYSGQTHDLAHNNFIDPADLKRARGLGAVFEMSPYLFHDMPVMADVEKVVGRERFEKFTPVADAIASGAMVTIGSDWNVVPSVNPWIAIETLVTRQNPGGGGRVIAGGERISLKAAIDLFTRKGARQMNRGGVLGTLEAGSLADLIVLDQNIFDVPLTDVHRTKTMLTMINGEIVYDHIR